MVSEVVCGEIEKLQHFGRRVQYEHGRSPRLPGTHNAARAVACELSRRAFVDRGWLRLAFQLYKRGMK